MTEPDINAVPEDLHTASAHVSNAVGGMESFELEGGSASSYGHNGLHATVLDLCSTVQHSVRNFHQDSQAASDGLTTAARTYVDHDGNVADTVNTLGKDL